MTKSKEIEVRGDGKGEVAEAEQTRPGPVYRPPVDIAEDVNGFTVLADLPGVEASGLQVDLRDGVLTIRAQCAAMGREDEHEILREFAPGTYFRQFTLPDAVEQARIEAKLADGVLRMRLPKVDAARPRRIQVKTG